MEKFYPYLDIVFLVLVFIFLLVMFLRVMGRRIGLQRGDTIEIANTNNNVKNVKTIKKQAATAIGEKKPLNNPEVFAEGSLNFKLEKVKKYDLDFNIKEFITSCKSIFTNIVTSFNSGNIDKVKEFLTPQMYEGFNNYIAEHSLNQDVEIEKFLIVDVVDVEFAKEKIINIKVKFVTKQKIDTTSSEFREIWNFTKDMKVKAKAWQLSQVLNG